MRVQQVPNSPYFIHYDDEGFCCISKSRESQEPIPESEMQAFLDAVANGLLYIEKERKSRYQRIDEAEKAAFAKGEAKYANGHDKQRRRATCGKQHHLHNRFEGVLAQRQHAGRKRHGRQLPVPLDG